MRPNTQIRSLVAAFTLLVAGPAFAAPIVSGDVFVTTSQSSFSNPTPDTYHLEEDGDFKGFFFAPISIGDVAMNNATDEVLFGSSNSGAIVRTDSRGGYLGMINTQASQIRGLAVGSNGDLFVADSTNNQLLRLDGNGSFRDLTFLPDTISALAIDANDTLIYARSTGGSSFNPQELVFLDFELGVVKTVLTTLRGITGIAVTHHGEILVAGNDSSSCCSGSKIFRLDGAGNTLGQLVGPSNVSGLATAWAPEPGTGVLLGFGLVALARQRKR